MNRRNLPALLCVVAVAGIVSTVWWLSRPPEPAYEGRALSEWLNDYSEDGISRDATDNAIRHIGTNAVPWLMRNLFTNDSELKDTLGAIAQEQHLIKIKFTPPQRRLDEARQAFWALGPLASNAVPELIQIYERNDSIGSQLCALEVLGNIGPPAHAAIPTLAGALNDKDSTLRAAASNIFKAIDPEAAAKAGVK